MLKNRKFLLSLLFSSFLTANFSFATEQNRVVGNSNSVVDSENIKDVEKNKLENGKDNNDQIESENKKLREKFDSWTNYLWDNKDGLDFDKMLDILDYRLKSDSIRRNFFPEPTEETICEGKKRILPWDAKHLKMKDNKFWSQSVLSSDNTTSEHLTDDQFRRLFENGNGDDAFQCLSDLSPSVRNKILEMAFKSMFTLAGEQNVSRDENWNFKKSDLFKYFKSITDKKWK